MIEIINKDRANDEATQVQYTFINFDLMLKKIRIDLIIKGVKENTNTLSFLLKRSMYNALIFL